MSLSSYSDLQTAIASWLNRQDLDAKIPDFVTLCEAKLRRLIVHENGLSASIDFTVSNQTWTLPDDFNGVIALTTDSTAAPVVPFAPVNQFFGFVNNSSGIPQNYTILGGRLYISPYPTSVNFTLAYKQKLDLAKYGPNWILDEHPDVYLYGSLIEAEPYIVEDERVPMWKQNFEEALSQIKLDAKRQQYSGPIQMATQNPLQEL